MNISRNMRGLNRSWEFREIATRLKKLNPEIGIFIETRVKQNKANGIRSKLGNHWSFINNYNKHENDGLWTLWDNNKFNIRATCSIEQLVHFGIYNASGDLRMWCTVIYAYNTLEKRKVLWQYIQAILSNTKGPWFFMGDYNNVMTIHERIGGNPVQEKECIVLRYMMNRTTKQRPKFNKSFKFFNVMVQIEWFLEVVEANWKQDMKGKPMYRVWKKLQRLQRVIKERRKPFHGNGKQLEKARENLDKAQQNLLIDRMDVGRINMVKFYTREVMNLAKIEENLLRQRAKIDWIKLGDSKNSFFYATLKSKYKQTNISFLKDKNGNQLVTHDFIETRLEIYVALKKISDLTAPGVDCYGAKFYKSTWHVINEDIIEAIQDFFVRGRMNKAVNNTLVTITPKHVNAWSIVDLNQIAYVLGQHIQDHILLAYELIRGYSTRGGAPICLIQMDIQKAYDSVEWKAMEDILLELGFPNKFIGWTMTMVRSVSSRYKINNVTSDNMQAKKGLRQGDPMQWRSQEF
ncbi:uncharacterized protein LOC131635037 [Vicia villosa]|uniref:uncharacterized protein LOC131635037 n=1 Tax=Vicia villosa TaxID=3911 RepID=UPI00273CF4BB|nr:uncharacterized protein LOC131635037 [Vicia villosa]